MLLLGAYVFFIMILKGNAFKDNYLYDMAFSKFGRFLFIPLLITGTMCLIPLTYDSLDYGSRNEKTAAIVALIFNIICLFCLIFIYCMLPECHDSIPAFIFKKCFISVSMAYQIYFFFNNIITIAYFDDPLLLKADQRRTWSWICMIIFSVVIGALTWLWKDVSIGVMGTLFNIAFFVLSNADLPKDNIPPGNRNKGNYIVSIIFSIVLAIESGALIALKKQEVMK